MVGTPEADDKESRMNDHSMVGSASCNLVKERKRLCDDEKRVNGVTEHRKHKKRGDNHKLKIEIATYKIRMVLRCRG